MVGYAVASGILKSALWQLLEYYLKMKNYKSPAVSANSSIYSCFPRFSIW